MQEIEIERKNLLTEAEYNRLIVGLSLEKAVPKHQINHYFETTDFQLKEQGSALRIRELNQTYTLTLKEPYQDGLLETHAKLTKDEAHQLIQNPGEIKPEISTRLSSLGVSPQDLRYGGTLETWRIEVQQDGVLVVLDKSQYLNEIDFELEIEGPTLQLTQSSLDYLIERFMITKKATPNKIARFYDALKRHE